MLNAVVQDAPEHQKTMTNKSKDFYFDEEGNKITIDGASKNLPSTSKSFSFPLRGNNLNPLIDSCSSLLALRVRLLTLNELEPDNVSNLYLQVSDDIRALEVELKEEDYSQASILICRYCLCCALDEIALEKDWGTNSSWAENSLLNEFHGETWGGEKFFTLLSRLSMEPTQHLELLELIFLLLSLGYKGKYADEKHGGNKEREKVLYNLNQLIEQYKEKPQGSLSTPTKYRVDDGFNMQLDIPPWLIYALSLTLLIILFLAFNASLDTQTERILQQLQSIK